MKLAIAVIGLTLMSFPAAAAEQFDLVCRGEARLSAIEPWRSDVSHFRVDLTNARWCEGACRHPQPLVASSPSTLTLKHHEPAFARDDRTDFVIDRRSGELRRLETGQVNFEQRGKCEPAPYSGMPGDGAAKF